MILDENKKIWVYGAASYAHVIVKILYEHNIEIQGFIDKRAEEIGTFYELPVCTIDNIKKNIFDKKNEMIVILAVKNVFEHQKIAKLLSENGVKKILYFPFSAIVGTATEQEGKLADLYDKLLEGRVELDKIPILKKINIYTVKDYARINIEDKVVINIPWFYIFTNFSKKETLWGNRNCMQLFPHINFFMFMMGQQENGISEYIDFCTQSAQILKTIKISTAWKKNIIKNRSEIYYNMQRSYEIDRGFFNRNAPTAKWNEKGFFNLTSGKHRVGFLLSKGQSFIALSIQEEDYQKYLRYVQEDLKIDMSNIDSNPLYDYSYNPYMMRYVDSTTEFYNKLAMILTKEISKIIYNQNKGLLLCQITILVNCSDSGFLGRILNKVGFNVIEVREWNQNEDCSRGNKDNQSLEIQDDSAVDYYLYEEPLDNNITNKPRISKNIIITRNYYQNQKKIFSGILDNYLTNVYLSKVNEI